MIDLALADAGDLSGSLEKDGFIGQLTHDGRLHFGGVP
jgi:hypothetical protein